MRATQASEGGAVGGLEFIDFISNPPPELMEPDLDQDEKSSRSHKM